MASIRSVGKTRVALEENSGTQALGVFSSDTGTESALRVLGVIFLLAWYFGSARAQATYVKDKFGTSYVHRSWGKPLGVAVGVMVGFYVACVAVAPRPILIGT